MQPADYFKRTFIFVFVFFLVYKFTYQIFEGIDNITAEFMLKTLAIVTLTALVLGIINYFLKIDIPKKKQ
ncbi:hypothetical protein [Flavobacterium sp.]|uniref:hypothetical protein n=1 Tax=Flavobacterium sp. TaxID=239 RepID=UPI00391B0E83